MIGRPTAVLVTRTRWSELPRLRHEVARALARSHRVLFAETPTTWRDRYPTTVEEVEPNILRCRLTNRVNLPERVRRYVPGANDYVQWRLLGEIRGCLAKIGETSRPVLVDFNHDATRIVESRGVFRVKVYLSNDDWVAKAPSTAARWVVARQEARVARAADLCLGVSYPIVDALGAHNPETHLFLPGHDFDMAAEPERRRDDAMVRVLFMGNVNRRVDLSWLSRVAAEPGMEMHVVGSVSVPEEAIRPLEAAGVRFHAAKHGRELQRSLEQADVLVIPYHLHEDVLAVTASNKLFKYIAAERPVVISNMPHFIDLGPGIIYRAGSPEEFIERIGTAVREDGEELRRRRRRIAEESRWEGRTRELLALIASVEQRLSGTS